jgi:hypothetical protein
MIRKILMLFVLIIHLAASGCAVVAIGVAGAGAGFGTYTYLEGELRRMYQAGHEESIQAVMSALPELAMSLKDKTSYDFGIKTVITAQRRDGLQVVIKIKSETAKVSEIGVRSGYVGIWDKQASEQIHDVIAQRLRQ